MNAIYIHQKVKELHERDIHPATIAGDQDSTIHEVMSIIGELNDNDTRETSTETER